MRIIFFQSLSLQLREFSDVRKLLFSLRPVVCVHLTCILHLLDVLLGYEKEGVLLLNRINGVRFAVLNLKVSNLFSLAEQVK